MGTILILVAGCAGSAPDSAPTPTPDPGPGWLVPPSPQRSGDPDAGYRALLNEGYVGCGVPYSLYPLLQLTGFGAGETLPGREGDNASMPYDLNAFPTAAGVEVVNVNCLSCHAAHIRGQLVIGLGESRGDYTALGPLTGTLAGWMQDASVLVPDPATRDELAKIFDRASQAAPYLQTKTVGANPADQLAGVLAAHRDQQTLAWTDDLLIPLPDGDAIPLDVPAWWNVKKKNATFYTAAGQGDLTRFMMGASMLCVDSVPQAQEIWDYFGDVQAYIDSLKPPPYPFPVDASLAATGKQVFEQTCSVCHGTYGPDGRYPNRVVPLETIGTDPRLVENGEQGGQPYMDWLNGSFYGQGAHYQPYHGYIAPPLDGVWATAPYFHNGSVPTVEAVLNSPTRPKYWNRSGDDSDYDPAALGWNFTALDHGQADELDPNARKQIYDTTLSGYSNAGHPFGDALSDADRQAVIEYLKTL